MACVTTGGGATLTFKSQGVGRLRNIGFYSETGSQVDNTDLSDSYVKMCPGDLIDYGTMTATSLWDTTGRTQWMHTDLEIHDQGTLTITFSDNTQIQGDAFMLSKSVGDHVNNQEVTANFEFVWTADSTQPGGIPTMSVV